MEKLILKKDKNTMETLSKAQQIKFIKSIWFKISYVLESKNERILNKYFEINRREERNHLKHIPSGFKQGLTLAEGSIYFAVKWIIEPLNEGFKYTVKDIINFREEALLGESIALNYEKELREALKDIDLKEWDNIDYKTLQGA